MSALPQAVGTRVCKRCQREFPETHEFFYATSPKVRLHSPNSLFERKCRACRSRMQAESVKAKKAIAYRARAAAVGQFKPRVIGESGPEGGFTAYPVEGWRFVCGQDSHGDQIDWEAAEAWLAFVRYYHPQVVYLLGDHVDFAQFSRFEKPPDRLTRVQDDIDACKRFLAKTRESAGPDARIVYLKGNHEARLRRYLSTSAQALAALAGLDVPNLLGLAEHRIEWVESGSVDVNDKLMLKHGHMVRARSGYTGTAELERNGVSGASGHTHRLGQIYKRNRVGTFTWVESGCLCRLDPDYMEGQTADWQHGLSFGSVSLVSDRFDIHAAPIIGGRVRLHGIEVGP